MTYEIKTADNGWIVSWVDEGEDGCFINHHQVFEIPDDVDLTKEDPQALIGLLYFVKEEVCGQYYSKHKAKNALVRLEGEDE